MLRLGLCLPRLHRLAEGSVALRKLDQSERRGFANSVSMAMELPSSRTKRTPVASVLKRIARRPILATRTRPLPRRV